jgi:DNA-directed RNA polymerase subunit RPC12/RpoP
MEETTVTEQSYDVHIYPITEYKCEKCGANFLDCDDNYAYCPYCGRKIVIEKE